MFKIRKTTDTFNFMRESMKRRDDYMSMRLPRSFANTVEQLLDGTQNDPGCSQQDANKANSDDTKSRASD